MTEVKKCSCRSEYQDQKYGQGMRVHNTVKVKSGTEYRCTVCGKVVK